MSPSPIEILTDPAIILDRHALTPGTTTVVLAVLACAALAWGGALAYRLVTGTDRPSGSAYAAYAFALALAAGITYDVIILRVVGEPFAGRIEDASTFTVTTRMRRSQVTQSREIALVDLVDDARGVRCHGETTGQAARLLAEDANKRIPFVSGAGMCLIGEVPTMAQTSVTMLGMVYALGLMLAWPKKTTRPAQTPTAR